MNEPLQSCRERELRAGARVRLGGRVGVLRYLYGPDAAVVRFDREASTKVVPLRRLVPCPDEPPPGAKTTVTYQGIEVTAEKDKLWHVEAAGKSASAAFLDQAIEAVLPQLSFAEQDSLVIQLLTATAGATS
jgi:hypothetical protein